MLCSLSLSFISHLWHEEGCLTMRVGDRAAPNQIVCCPLSSLAPCMVLSPTLPYMKNISLKINKIITSSRQPTCLNSKDMNMTPCHEIMSNIFKQSYKLQNVSIFFPNQMLTLKKKETSGSSYNFCTKSQCTKFSISAIFPSFSHP